jgi:hypothetical protein
MHRFLMKKIPHLFGAGARMTIAERFVESQILQSRHRQRRLLRRHGCHRLFQAQLEKLTARPPPGIQVCVFDTWNVCSSSEGERCRLGELSNACSSWSNCSTWRAASAMADAAFRFGVGICPNGLLIFILMFMF